MNILLRDERLKSVPSKIRNRHRAEMSAFTTSIQHCTGILARATRASKEIKAPKLGRKKSKYLCSHHLMWRNGKIHERKTTQNC